MKVYEFLEQEEQRKKEKQEQKLKTFEVIQRILGDSE